MKFIVLGTGPGLPQPDRNLSSIYVQMNGMPQGGEGCAATHILADCGEGTAQKMRRHHLDQNVIDAILITHFHPDHIAGIYMVLQMMYLQNRTKELKLFLPERTEDFLQTLTLFYTFPERFGFALEVCAMEEVGQYFPGVVAMANDHLHGYREYIRNNDQLNTMKAYSLRFEGYDGSLVYTSDIETTECIHDLLVSAHTVIIDALHPDPQQITRLRDFDVQRILLTHGMNDQLARWWQQAGDQRFENAVEDHIYHIGTDMTAE